MLSRLLAGLLVSLLCAVGYVCSELARKKFLIQLFLSFMVLTWLLSDQSMQGVINIVMGDAVEIGSVLLKSSKV